LNTTDLIILVLRGHPYLEAMLIKHIESKMVDSRRFDNIAAKLPSEVAPRPALSASYLQRKCLP
jgi:hypothetical protein